MYCVEVVRGNGYRCGCCRQTWNETESFDSYEEALEHIADIRFKRDNEERFQKIGVSVEEDIYVKRLYRSNDGDGINEDKVSKLQEEMEAKLKKREANAKRAAKARAAKAKKTKEANERKKLAQLKKKYEGVKS